jgi:hypothetical protein
LSLKDILNVSAASTYLYRVCSDDVLWQILLTTRFDRPLFVVNAKTKYRDWIDAGRTPYSNRQDVYRVDRSQSWIAVVTVLGECIVTNGERDVLLPCTATDALICQLTDDSSVVAVLGETCIRVFYVDAGAVEETTPIINEQIRSLIRLTHDRWPTVLYTTTTNSFLSATIRYDRVVTMMLASNVTNCYADHGMLWYVVDYRGDVVKVMGNGNSLVVLTNTVLATSSMRQFSTTEVKEMLVCGNDIVLLFRDGRLTRDGVLIADGVTWIRSSYTSNQLAYIVGLD